MSHPFPAQVAADAFLLALGVTIIDIRSMLVEFTQKQLPASLEDAMAIDIHARKLWFAALFSAVLAETYVSHRVARPFLDAMIRGDWRHAPSPKVAARGAPSEATPLLPP